MLATDPALLTKLLYAADQIGTDIAQAIEVLREILGEDPGQTDALMLLAGACRCAGDSITARALLEEISERNPGVATPQFEIGRIYLATRENVRASESFSQVVRLEPDHPKAWRLLGQAFSRLENDSAAAAAFQKHHALKLESLRSAQEELDSGREGEQVFTELLERHPTDVSTARILAEGDLRNNLNQDAETRLRHILMLAPEFSQARYMLAVALHRQTKAKEAVDHLDILLAAQPENISALNLKATCLLHLGEYDNAIACYENLLNHQPNALSCWVGYGHALKTVARIQEAVAAFRKAAEMKPDYGEAYWQLADLKTFRFSLREIKTMRRELARGTLASGDRTLLHFALGKAMEDEKDYARSFQEYAKGNDIKRQTLRYSADDNSASTWRSAQLFSAAFFEKRKGWGASANTPIFILGLTRSGSTLVDQILASHPSVEGTAELPALSVVVQELREKNQDNSYPELIETLEAEDCRWAGERYLELAGLHRKTPRPFFIDKMPANFHYLGLLHLALPNAKIIDARRHPLACGFANFKQHFTHGQSWSYSLDDIARYYRDYAMLMAHFDKVLPGRVHRVIYETLVSDPESETRRLLDYCGLPFNDACLRFYENKRAVLTASAEQVRRPVFKDSLEQWRNFEPWLTPFKYLLGSVAEHYPAVPMFEPGKRRD